MSQPTLLPSAQAQVLKRAGAIRASAAGCASRTLRQTPELRAGRVVAAS